MLNASYVGRSLPTTAPVTITDESVTRFAQSLGLAAAHPDGTHASQAVLPPTYLISLTLPAADPLIEDPEFGLDFSRVLHREQRFAYHRELTAGAQVSCTVTVESIKTVAGNDLLSLHTAVEDGLGLAAEVWTTLFVAGDPA
ncbi:MaoC family dehydratase N-terminal domain-containing protein [Glycomyces sp. NRRL B-16210]|uniref:FAS1-like dehydratase domain-containing protein n=1 Tax=Glycomyces sp. NRRL B-16210 TaxID=1463821 RepID=UPI00068B65A6|nr:MaoC family dehydratase N-terminal domain-containing protein [Glycomyces sp. NRRL B-16210]